MSKLLIEVHEILAGSTLLPTWYAPGVTPTAISSALRDASDAIVNSVAAISSGGGYYFAVNQVPNSVSWYVNEWVAVVSGTNFVSRQLVRAVLPEVD